MKYLLMTLLAMTTVLASCGKENPLDGKPKGVQEGNLPDSNKPQGEDDKSLFVIHEVEKFAFVEQQNASYVIEGRTTIPNAQTSLRVENLKDFPGSKFDEKTGVFTWTPPKGTVDTDDDKKLMLQVTVYTNNLGSVRSRKSLIEVDITSSKTAPEIVSMTFDRTMVREGDVANLTIQIRDYTGVNSAGGRPTLQLSITNRMNPSNFEDASMINFANTTPTQDPVDKTLWTYRLRLDLTNRDVTPSSKSWTVTATAISRFRIASQEEDANINVYSNLKTPSISWNSNQQMKAGIKNSFSFIVFDPRGEGDVQMNMTTNCAMIHPNLICGPCVKGTDPSLGSILTCPVSWDIPSDYLTWNSSTVRLDMQLFSKSKIVGDSYQSPAANVSRVIEILPADVVAPVGGQ